MSEESQTFVLKIIENEFMQKEILNNDNILSLISFSLMQQYEEIFNKKIKANVSRIKELLENFFCNTFFNKKSKFFIPEFKVSYITLKNKIRSYSIKNGKLPEKCKITEVKKKIVPKILNDCFSIFSIHQFFKEFNQKYQNEINNSLKLEKEKEEKKKKIEKEISNMKPENNNNFMTEEAWILGKIEEMSIIKAIRRRKLEKNKVWSGVNIRKWKKKQCKGFIKYFIGLFKPSESFVSVLNNLNARSLENLKSDAVFKFQKINKENKEDLLFSNLFFGFLEVPTLSPEALLIVKKYHNLDF